MEATNSFEISDETEESAYFKSPIIIRQVKNVTNLDSVATHFRKELKKIALEDLIEADQSLISLIKRIIAMRYNRILFQGEKNNLVVDIDIVLEEFTAFRNRKIIATGTFSECQAAVHEQINKEFGDKFSHISMVDMDETWIKNFCQLHWNNPKQLQIIKL